MHIRIGVFLALMSLNASAANWLAITRNETTLLYIDLQSVAKEGQFRKAWYKFEYAEPQQISTYDKRTYDLAKTLWYFDCNKRKYQVVQDLNYLEQALIESSVYKVSNEAFLDITPETMGETAYVAACNYPLKR